jgi:hypothetical protein
MISTECGGLLTVRVESEQVGLSLLELALRNHISCIAQIRSQP